MKEKKSKSMKRTEEIRKIVQSFNLTSDFFMSVALEDKKACEYILRIFMEKQDLMVREVKTQYSIRQVGTHSVILDALAEDGEGKLYEIEIQNGKNEDHIRRVRYITACVDTSVLDKGTGYADLPELHLFYITTFDLAGLGKTVYHVDRKIRGTEKCMDNGVYEHYINTAVDDGSRLAELMHYFVETDARDRRHGALSDRVAVLKETGKGENYMCEIIDKLREESRQEGRQEGLAEGEAKKEAWGKQCKIAGTQMALSIAKLYYAGKTIDQIVLKLNLPREEVAAAVSELEAE